MNSNHNHHLNRWFADLSFTNLNLSQHSNASSNSIPKRQTPAVLRKFEKAAIIGHRAQQISEGATILVPLENGENDAVVIAMKELHAGKLTGSVIRVLPDGEKETYQIQDLKIQKNPGDP